MMKRLAILGLLVAFPCWAQTPAPVTVTLTPASPSPWPVPADWNNANNTIQICPMLQGVCTTLTNQSLLGPVPFAFTGISATFNGKTINQTQPAGKIVISYTPAVVPPPPVSGVVVTPFTPPVCAAAGDKLVGPYDSIPNFALNPTVTSASSGSWSNPATWAGGKVPGAGDVVKIACGHIVIYDLVSDAALAALGIDGELDFTVRGNTRMKVGTILINRAGRLRVVTLDPPVADGVTAEIIVADRPLATLAADPQTGVVDPAQFGTGVLVFGEWVMAGKTRDRMAQLAQEPKAGDTGLTLAAAPQGWQAGDTLVLPDTRQLDLNPTGRTPPSPSQIEEPTVAAIAGAVVTLTKPLAFSHLAGRQWHDKDGNTLTTPILLMPHVGNQTSNVTIRSENPSGTRGHILATEYARVDSRYVTFRDLGRTTSDALNPTTNHIGRYALHIHHVAGPKKSGTDATYQFASLGNAIVNSKKWSMSVHDSHWGYVGKNLFYGADGALFVLEAANETHNVIENNLAIKAGVMHDGLYTLSVGGLENDDGNPLRIGGEFGYEGSCYWLTAPDNYFRNNVAADCAFAGIEHSARAVTGSSPLYAIMPKFQGAPYPVTTSDDPHESVQDSLNWKVVDSPPLLQDTGNTVYSSGLGLWSIWGWHQHHGTISKFLAWNIRQRGAYVSRHIAIAFDDFRLINDQAVSNRNAATPLAGANFGIDQQGGDNTYSSGQQTYKNFVIEGYNIGVHGHSNIASGSYRSMNYFDHGVFANYVNYVHWTPTDANDLIFNSVKFVQNPGTPFTLYHEDEGVYDGVGSVAAAISPSFEAPGAEDGLTRRGRTFLFDYNKTGKNLQFFYPWQAPGFVMVEKDDPDGHPLPFGNCVDAAGALHAGLTNQQCHDQFGVSTMGEITTCADKTTYPELHGFTCPATLTLDDVLSGK